MQYTYLLLTEFDVRTNLVKGFIFNSVTSSLHSLTDFLLPIITWPKGCLSEYKKFIIIAVKLIVFTLENFDTFGIGWYSYR